MTPHPPTPTPRRLQAPLRYCTGKGGRCPNRVASGKCPACRAQGEQARGSAHQRGYTSAWSRYAASWKRSYPLCGMRADGLLHVEHSECAKNGMVTAAYAVDHIVPHQGPADPSFMDPMNHQSLCQSCHSIKTAREDGGFGNRRGA